MKKVHFLGIGGSGASAAASIALSQGFEVTGCDLNPHNEFTREFPEEKLFKSHSPSHLRPQDVILQKAGIKMDTVQKDYIDSHFVDILAVTPAILSKDPNNPELLEAREKGIVVMTWQQFMGEFLEKGKFVVAVCGTHGKSTTTAMVGQMLENAGLDPTVELGAVIPKWGRNFRIGKSRYFVTEADEFNDNFLSTQPDITVLTNVEMDHPEYFKNFDDVKQSFLSFLYQTKKKIIANLEDEGVRAVMEVFQRNKQKPYDPELIDYSKSSINFELKVPGRYNSSNATAVMQVGLSLGVDPYMIQKSLMSFTGIGRRFELLGKYHGADVYSDFGHHPTEVRVTVEAAREKFQDKKIWLIFQPHMFSRTKALFDDFVKVLKEVPVDQILIMDIYAGREKDTGVINSKQLVEAINKDADSSSKKSYAHIGSGDDVKQLLSIATKEGDILFFIGAGDIDKVARSLIN